ncbi:MAG: YfhO family protein [Deltaproteobacteria bacterium]
MPAGSDERASRWSPLLGGVVVAVGIIALVWPAVRTSDVLYFRDHTAIFRLLLQQVVDAYGAGEWALWNASTGGGEPLAAYAASMAYTPLLVVFTLPGDFHALYDVFIAAHYVVAAGGAYVLARTVGMSRSAAWMAAAAYALSGTLVSLNSLIPALSSAAFGPWALAAAVRVFDRPSPLGLAGLAVALALHVFGTDPAFLVCDVILFTVIAWPRVRRATPAHRGRALLALLAGAAVAAGMSAIFVLPTMDLLSGSLRGEGFSYAVNATYSLPPLRLLELFLSGVNGDYYDGPTFFGDHRPDLYLPSLYVGATVFPVWAWGVLTGRERRFTVTAVAFLLLALGHYTPVHQVVVEVVPGLASSRYPIKFMYGFQVAAALAIARAVDALASSPGDLQRSLRGTLFAVGGAMLAATCVLSVFPQWLEPLIVEGYTLAQTEPYFAGALAQATLFGGAGLLVVVLVMRQPGVAPIAALALVAVLAADLALTGQRDFSVEARALYDAPPARRHLATPDGAPPVLYLTQPRRMVPGGRLRDTTWFTASRLVAGTGGMLDVRYVIDPDLNSTRKQSWRQANDLASGLPLGPRVAVLGRLGVTHVLADGGPAKDLPGLRYVATEEVMPGAHVAIYAVRAHRRRFSLASSIESVATPRALAEGMLRSPLSTALVLNGDGAMPSIGPTATATIAAQYVADDRVELTVTTTAARGGLLVVTGRHGKGWHATVDGHAVETVPVELLLLGVPVPTGTSNVELVYRPRSFTLGRTVTAVSAVVTLLLFVVGWRRRPVSSSA